MPRARSARPLQKPTTRQIATQLAAETGSVCALPPKTPGKQPDKGQYPAAPGSAVAKPRAPPPPGKGSRPALQRTRPSRPAELGRGPQARVAEIHELERASCAVNPAPERRRNRRARK